MDGKIKIKPLIKKLPELQTNLRVLTWNVWFDDANFNERMLAIVEIITKSEADIVCLQEVTKESFLIFDTLLKEKYTMIDGFN